MMNRRGLIKAAVASTGLALVGSPGLAHAADPGAELMAAFRKEFERPRVPLAPEVTSREARSGLAHEKLRLSSEAGVRVPVLTTRRADATDRLPVMICHHGLGGNKEGLAPYLDEFARRGFLAVGIDARYHGERQGDVQAAMAESFRTGKERPYLWDTVWDTWRVMDYLQQRPDVDGERLGVMGISLGGHTTWMVCADPRVKLAVPCISVCSWQWQLAHEGYKQRVQNLSKAFDGVLAAMGEKTVTPKVVAEAWRRWLPGVPDRWDCEEILLAFAPRPLLIVGGDSDPVAPLEGVKEAITVITDGYLRAKATDRLQISIAEKTGHTITPAQQGQIFAWCDRWLKPTS